MFNYDSLLNNNIVREVDEEEWMRWSSIMFDEFDDIDSEDNYNEGNNSVYISKKWQYHNSGNNGE